MTSAVQLTQWVFLAAWIVATVAFFYGNYHWMIVWRAGRDGVWHPPGHVRKALIGLGVFLGAVALAVGAGVAGEMAGGWR